MQDTVRHAYIRSLSSRNQMVACASACIHLHQARRTVHGPFMDCMDGRESKGWRGSRNPPNLSPSNPGRPGSIDGIVLSGGSSEKDSFSFSKRAFDRGKGRRTSLRTCEMVTDTSTCRRSTYVASTTRLAAGSSSLRGEKISHERRGKDRRRRFCSK